MIGNTVSTLLSYKILPVGMDAGFKD